MKTTIETNLQDPEFRRHFAEEGFVVECMERVCEWMEREDVTRAELARRLGTTPANVTQMLSGRNVSLRTLASVAHVLGGVPEFRIIGASEPAPVGSFQDEEEAV